MLTKRGLAPYLKLKTLSHNADLNPENQPWRQVQDVIDGKLDVAGVWGPFAGWLKKMKGEPMTSCNPSTCGRTSCPWSTSWPPACARPMRGSSTCSTWRWRHSKAEIEKILTDYGVPLVECSTCLVQGNLPSHGAYIKPPVDRIQIEARSGVARSGGDR